MSAGRCASTLLGAAQHVQQAVTMGKRTDSIVFYFSGSIIFVPSGSGSRPCVLCVLHKNGHI